MKPFISFIEKDDQPLRGLYSICIFNGLVVLGFYFRMKIFPIRLDEISLVICNLVFGFVKEE